MSPENSALSNANARGPRRMGYWADPDEAITAACPDPRRFVDNTWDSEERRRVVEYLKHGSVYSSELGYSWCRFDCGIPEWEMGDSDLTDGVYIWPQGFAHYVEQHGVKPPADFIAHVLSSTQRGAPSESR